MPSITLRPPAQNRSSGALNALPPLLQTPSGLAILEIQGTVNQTAATAEQSDSSDDSIQLGKLIFPHYDPAKPADDTSWQKRVYLYVGKHQRLTGEAKKLSKPLAIVKRTGGDNGTTSANEGLEIAEIVHYKLLFAHRPEPVGQSGGV